MDYTHLTDEEVTYELALRHVVNLGPTTHRGKVLRLKALMQEEALRDNQPTSSAHVMSPQSNIEICETQIQQLHISTEAAIRTADRAAISQSRTRLTHYRDRLRLIHPPVELRDLHGMLTMHVTVLLNKVNGTSVVSCVQRGGNEVNHTSSTGAIRRSNNEEEGAVGGTADATIPVGNHSNQESTPPPASQPPSMTSFSGGQGRGLLFSSSFRARDNEDAGETQPRQRNTSPPPPYLPRERETWNRSAPEAQSREVQELHARIAEMQEREQRTREENYRMRDDLERLIRRDRPAPERADDRRIQKAVHNCALLEPNFATPVVTSRPPPVQHHQQSQRFNRVHAVEVEEAAFEHEAAEEGPEDNWQHNIDELVEQVNALKLNIERRSARPSFAARDERQPRPTDRYNRTEADVLRAARQYTRDAQTPAQQQRPQTASYQTRLPQQQQEQPQRAQGWQARQWMPSSDQSDYNRRSQRLLPEPARRCLSTKKRTLKKTPQLGIITANRKAEKFQPDSALPLHRFDDYIYWNLRSQQRDSGQFKLCTQAVPVNHEAVKLAETPITGRFVHES
nr:uncharacterized protein LOC115265170 [Aedes albopictus]